MRYKVSLSDAVGSVTKHRARTENTTIKSGDRLASPVKYAVVEEFGRLATLKMSFPKGSAGSSPAFGTKTN